MHPDWIARFWARVDKRGPAECWEWRRSRSKAGYGRVRAGGHLVYAHRAAWVLASNALIPDEMCVCHRCDNPPCCNPAHLFLATQAQNVRDRDSKGRGKQGPVRRGEQNPRARLTNAQVDEIRALLVTRTRRSVAEMYGVAQTTISAIATGTNWRR